MPETFWLVVYNLRNKRPSDFFASTERKGCKEHPVWKTNPQSVRNNFHSFVFRQVLFRFTSFQMLWKPKNYIFRFQSVHRAIQLKSRIQTREPSVRIFGQSHEPSSGGLDYVHSPLPPIICEIYFMFIIFEVFCRFFFLNF